MRGGLGGGVLAGDASLLRLSVLLLWDPRGDNSCFVGGGDKALLSDATTGKEVVAGEDEDEDEDDEGSVSLQCGADAGGFGGGLEG